MPQNRTFASGWGSGDWTLNVGKSYGNMKILLDLRMWGFLSTHGYQLP